MTKNVIMPLALLLMLTACHKKKDDSTSANPNEQLPALVDESTGWKRVKTIEYTRPFVDIGGFYPLDITGSGQTVQILYRESEHAFGTTDLTDVVYNATCNTNSTDTAVRHNMNNATCFEHAVFVNRKATETLELDYQYVNGVPYRIFSESNGINSVTRQYLQMDEAYNTIAYKWNVFDNAWDFITYSPGGSVVFTKADLYGPYWEAAMDGYNAVTKQWMDPYKTYKVSTGLPTQEPAFTGMYGFVVGDDQFRAISIDQKGYVSILQPITGSFRFDTITQQYEAGLEGAYVIGATYNGSKAIVLAYKDAKLYEYSWAEGDASITKVFAGVAASKATQQAVKKNHGYFKMRADGVAYQLMIDENGDYSLRVIDASGDKSYGLIARSSLSSNQQIGPVCYVDGTYYAVVYMGPGSNTFLKYTLRMDLIALKP